MPFGSCAHKDAFGMSFFNLLASGFAFHGRLKSPITTSLTRFPSLFGSDHFQQNPAVILAEYPSSSFSFIATERSQAESTILNSNSSCRSQITLAVLRTINVLFTQFTKASEPLQRNCASSSYSNVLALLATAES